METLTHYQKYKESIELWRKSNQERVNTASRRRRAEKKSRELIETNKQIALEYIKIHRLDVELS
jgi:hypothetical protein